MCFYPLALLLLLPPPPLLPLLLLLLRMAIRHDIPEGALLALCDHKSTALL